MNDKKFLFHYDNHAAEFDHTGSILEWFDSLPNVLGGRDIKEVVEHLMVHNFYQRPIIWGCGAHVLKIGLSPILIELMKIGMITHLSVNNAFVIHDLEIGMYGATSEIVDDELLSGNFGVDKTIDSYRKILDYPYPKHWWLGERISYFLSAHPTDLSDDGKMPKYCNKSVLYHAGLLNIPVTVHTTSSTDVVSYELGQKINSITHLDFRKFVSDVGKISIDGGAYLNVGSAVILPETFLKAVSQCTKQGLRFRGNNFITVAFDFIRQYRVMENVVKRPTKLGENKGYYFVGQNEIMIPLLASVLYQKIVARYIRTYGDSRP